MKCTECGGKGEEQYGDERLMCIACHGSGVASQASIHGGVREYPDAREYVWQKSGEGY